MRGPQNRLVHELSHHGFLVARDVVTANGVKDASGHRSRRIERWELLNPDDRPAPRH